MKSASSYRDVISFLQIIQLSWFNGHNREREREREYKVFHKLMMEQFLLLKDAV